LHPFLAIIGASGSGKSSLVHAGLIPELNKSQLLGEGDWLFSSFRPTEGPKDRSLVHRLETHLGGRIGDPESASSSIDSLLQVAREAGQPDAQQLLLIIDQFEEVYTLQNERDEKLRLSKEDADEFQEALLRLADVPECYVVLTVRADFFGDLMESPIWKDGVKNHRYELTTLGPDGMRQAIVQPALDQGVCISDVLAERLLAEAGNEPGILPFLQETLVLLWDKLQWRYLSVLDYESMVKGRREEFGSGLEVAMGQRAEATIKSLPSDEHRLVARRILLRLVQFDEGRSHTRRQQTVAQLSSAHADKLIFETTLKHLTEKRLLTIGDARAGQDALATESRNGDENNEFRDDHRAVDIAHDKLIKGWPALRTWIRERRISEETRRTLEGKTNEWVRLGRRRFAGGLLDKIELVECDKWLESEEASELGHIPELHKLRMASRTWVRLQQGIIIAIPVLILVAIGLWVWGQYSTALADLKAQLEQDKRRELAIASFSSIADSLSTSFRLLRAEGLLDNTELRSYRTRLISETRSQLDTVAHKVADDEEALKSLGETYIGLAWDTHEQGAQVEAIALYENAIKVFKQLQDLNSHNVEYKLREAFCYNNQGWSYDILDNGEALDRVQKKALSIREGLFKKHPANPDVVRALAVSYGSISQKLYERGERSQAKALSAKAIETYRQVIALQPNNGWHRLNISHQLNSQAKWLWEEGEWQSSIDLRQDALELRRELVGSFDADTSGIAREVYEYWQARSLAEIANSRFLVGDTTGAETDVKQAVEQLSAILAAIEENKRAQTELANARLTLAQIYNETERKENAETTFVLSIQGFESITSSDASVDMIVRMEYQSKLRYGEFLSETGNPVSASEMLRDDR
ncbi:MAG: NACHT domain-containing protein, partial [Gammaproteobacteria bacterium]|nr:NACHT domain-containing protein [Gammaproteobacteria bacterium]